MTADAGLEPVGGTARRLPSWTSALPIVVMVAAALGLVIGLIVVQQLGARTRNVLAIAADAAVLAEAAADPIAMLPGDVAQVAAGVSSTLSAVRDITGTASTTTASLADALDSNVATTATATAAVADRVASVLETIERFIPGDVESLAEELRAASDGLAPVPGQLGAIAEELRSGAADLDAAIPRIETLEEQLAQVNDRLDDASRAVADLPALAAEVRREVADARNDLNGTLWLLRALVVLAALATAAIGWCLRLLVGVAAYRQAAELTPTSPTL
jgi:ABC-type transporter Mla subunit MlaD